MIVICIRSDLSKVVSKCNKISIQKFKAIIAVYDLKIPKENSKEFKKVEKSMLKIQCIVFQENQYGIELINKLVEELLTEFARWQDRYE